MRLSAIPAPIGLNRITQWSDYHFAGIRVFHVFHVDQWNEPFKSASNFGTNCNLCTDPEKRTTKIVA